LSVGKPQAELSVERTVSETFDLYFKNFATLFIPMLIAYLITGGIGAALTHFYTSNIPLMPTTNVLQDVLNWINKYMPTLIAVALVSALAGWIINVIVYGTIIKCSSELVEKNKTSLKGAVRFTARKLPSLLAAAILLLIIIVAGLIALVIPGIILGIMLSLTLSAIVIENVGTFDGMSRSRALVNHRWLKTFAILLIMIIIQSIVSAIASVIAGSLGSSNWMFSWILSSIITALIAPILPIALTVHYYSMRAKEQPAAPLQPPKPPF
jgi:hypothetical protein